MENKQAPPHKHGHPQMKDQLIRGTAWDGKLRGFALRCTELVREMQQRHSTLPTATAALGRTAAAAAMIGAMLQDDEKLTVQVKGDGPLGQIVVDANALGEVRGYVDNPEVNLPPNAQGKIDVRGGVGTTGFIHIIKDLGLKEPYRGSSPIVSGELAEDFTYYFAISEQTPSVVGLGVLVDIDGSVLHAGGFIIQLMPGLGPRERITDAEITKLEEAVASMPPVTSLLTQGETPEGILKHMVGDNFTLLAEQPVVFKCQCSQERVERTMLSLGAHELQNLIDEGETVEVVCHFCNTHYQLSADELRVLLEQAQAATAHAEEQEE
jgi:molecular chaperone Hsp33